MVSHDQEFGTDEEAEVTGTLFSDADVFEPDSEIRQGMIEEGNDDVLDETQLRANAAVLLGRLRELEALRERRTK